MKKNIILKSCTLFLCVTVVFFVSGCSKSGSGEIISYSISADPKNLDPQTATSSNALIVIDNIFEGLYKKDAEGNLVLGAAISCEKSEDGLTYIFSLPTDINWKYYANENKVSEDKIITSKVTSHDFVYAFTRLFDPHTNAPSASDYYCIKNSQAVKEGKLPVSQLGVKALDDYTLEFTLSSPNPLFEELLAQSSAVPCNQEFFENATGRYGLSKETLLTNGPFYVSEWSNNEDSSYVRIRKNSFYKDADSVIPAGANLTVRSDDAAISSFKKGDIDALSVNASDYHEINGKKYPSTAYQNTVVGILFNPKEEHFANLNVRKAFALDVNRDDFASSLSQDQIIASAIVPPSSSIGGSSYRAQAGDSVSPGYDPNKARSLLEQGIVQLKKNNKKVTDFNTLTILAPEEAAVVVQKILQLWQKDLGVYLKTEILPQSEYQQRLKSGDFSCAVVAISGSSSSPASVLKQFETDSSTGYCCGLLEYDSILAKAAKQSSISDIVSCYKQAESLLLNNGVFIPIYYQQDYFLTQSNIENLLFDVAGGILYFQYTKKG